jgi:glycine C-acetyltransferase
MSRAHLTMLAEELAKLEQAGLYRPERVIPQNAAMVDLTSQDHLGLAADERVLGAARAALDAHGLGAGAPRMFAGTRPIHQELERAIARFLQVPDAIVFGAGYLANLGFYEALFDNRDCLFCDALVHPSTAEGVRLSNATAFPFRNNDVEDLEDKLKRSRSARFRAIATDGVFAFEGKVADLGGICALAERYEAMVVVDDALGVGVLGARGRGAREYRDVMSRVDVVTGTFGKALGGAGGGFVAGKREVIEWVRQKATPYLFSIGFAPPLAAAALTAVELLERGAVDLAALRARTKRIAEGLAAQGFKVFGGEDHPSLAVLAGGALTLQKLVDALHERGVRVSGVCYPVVPESQGRVRIEVTLRLTDDDIARVLRAFELAGQQLRVI